jgi:hypothetical protein
VDSNRYLLTADQRVLEASWVVKKKGQNAARRSTEHNDQYTVPLAFFSEGL